ncbi:hypothetical protein J4229_02385 [Candidatus Pacearchaeota archaeon]|nr:hypothetical protein [Candidatus Pacearchaeota archaeon]
MNKRYKITKEFREAIKNSGLSINELSKKLNFEVKNITSRNDTIREDNLEKLKQYINLPTIKETKINYIKNLGYTFIDRSKKLRENKFLAELIGIVLGDGNLCRNRIHISFDKRAKHYIDYVSKLFYRVTGIKLKYNQIAGTNQSYLYCYNQNLSENFVKCGLQRGDKIVNQARIPLWVMKKKEYMSKTIRGLIDTDGCIYKCKREKQIYVKFTNFNNSLLKDFKTCTNLLGYSFAKSNKHNLCLYRKQEVVRFIKYIQPCKAIGVVV